MNRIYRAIAVILIVLGCTISVLVQPLQSALTVPPIVPKSSPRGGDLAQTINFGRHFQELGVEGSIAIYDLNSDRLYQHNPQRNATAFLPASTFKIVNSLISLETGVISDELAVLTWDGIQRQISGWNRDLNMREAIKLSAVWFYQVLARRVGHEQMQKWVAKVGYGNQKIGNKDDIDKFWLEGELRITPNEQIQFLRRLYKNDLPFSERSLSLVKDIIVVEKTPDYIIRAKTGWVSFGEQTGQEIGWYVGYLENNKNVYFFATNINIRNNNDASARQGKLI
ncbi:class D beta-lactamase [Microcoleus sp. Pol12A5]|uniref:class D beta-lactamase n=1 Tax=Microcoleus sp. Pol12A5 TaxID=3055392 RepID=UPI002FD2183D